MHVVEYDRKKAIQYAEEWAYRRNPAYYNFDSIGGDCTNFVSQCILEGSKMMNYDKINGWNYIDGNHKSASWTGVEYLHQFLTSNKTVGPYGMEVTKEEVEVGDIIQLSFDRKSYSHTTIIVDKKGNELQDIYVAAHTFDTYHKKILNYQYENIRLIHIQGVKKW